jgi:hypothetical protein
MWGIKLVVLIEGDQYLPLLVTTLMPTRRLGSSSSLEHSFKTFVTFCSSLVKIVQNHVCNYIILRIRLMFSDLKNDYNK